MVVCLAREDLYFGALWWEWKVVPAEKWPVEGSHFPTQQGTCPESGCGSAEK